MAVQHHYELGASLDEDLQLLARAEQAYEENAQVEGLRANSLPSDVRGPVSRALVWANDLGGRTVVALRGTKTEQDMAVDREITLVPRDTSDDGFVASVASACAMVPARVHAGFAQALVNLKAAGLTEQILSASSTRHAGVILTGHSLGGAIATLLGLELARKHGFLVTVVTWGAPQVGDGVFAALVHKQHRLRVLRAENSTDLICTMPGALAVLDPQLEPYAPCGERVRLDDGDLIDQALQYLERAVRAVASQQDAWKILGKISAHSVDAYRANLLSRHKNPMERMLEKGARVASFMALAAQVVAEAEATHRQAMEVARQQGALIDSHSPGPAPRASLGTGTDRRDRERFADI